jgi:hypothetical protein
LKTRGLVLEVNKNNVLVLTRDGRFKNLPRRGRVEVGSEYSYGTYFPRAQLAVAAVMLLALASVLLPLQGRMAPAAYITLDINPSVELVVNSSQRVIGVEALNEDGAKLIGELRLKGENLQYAIEALLRTAEEQDYLVNDVVVASSPAPGNESLNMAEINEKITQVTNDYISSKTAPVRVTVLSTNQEIREEARENGLSTGKFAVYLEAKNEGLPLEITDLQSKGINKALLEAEAKPAEVLRRVENEKDFNLLSLKLREKVTATNNEKDLSALEGKDPEDPEDPEEPAATLATDKEEPPEDGTDEPPGDEDPVVDPDDSNDLIGDLIKKILP